jgi:hypothetical protein
MNSRQTHSILQHFNTSILALFEELPLAQAMPDLVPRSAASKEAHHLASEAVKTLDDPALRAGIWLYVDDLEASHMQSQALATPTGSFWHAIMHRREGDFGNSLYWLRQAGSHPVWNQIERYEPFDFLGQVASRHRENPAELVELQRIEWFTLFCWCASEGAPA